MRNEHAVMRTVMPRPGEIVLTTLTTNLEQRGHWKDLGEKVIRLLLTSALQLSFRSAASRSRPQNASAGVVPATAKAGIQQLERVLAMNLFEIYRIRPGVFAIYEPKQFEE